MITEQASNLTFEDMQADLVHNPNSIIVVYWKNCHVCEPVKSALAKYGFTNLKLNGVTVIEYDQTKPGLVMAFPQVYYMQNGQLTADQPGSLARFNQRVK